MKGNMTGQELYGLRGSLEGAIRGTLGKRGVNGSFVELSGTNNPMTDLLPKCKKVKGPSAPSSARNGGLKFRLSGSIKQGPKPHLYAGGRRAHVGPRAQ